MSEPDLSAIVPPANPPSDVPDEKTKAEEQQLAKKATPTEREAAAHQAHLDTHRERINHHCAEVADLRAEMRALRQELKEALAVTGQRDARIKELETANAYGGALYVLGNLATLVGGGCSGLAGAAPLPDPWKVALSSAGVALTVAGIAIVATVSRLGRR